MQITFKSKQFFVKLFLTCMFSLVQTQENDFKCLQYKKLIFETTRTFSNFQHGASEILIVEDHCSSSRGFVVGGENAQPKEFPFAARLGNKADNGYINWFCGGTLLSKYFVLTAAHCFYASLGDINLARLGDLDFNSNTDDAKPEDFGVRELIEYPQYDNNLPYNDIGLVMLSSAVEFDRYKHPACLPILSNAENSNNYIAIGWGHIKFAGPSSSHLQKVSLQSYSHPNCQWLADGPEGRERLPNGLLNSQLCAGSTQVKDTCQGDSGGPLLVQHPKYPCMYNVVGITSMGYGGCALPNVPALYTRVKNYINWINYYIERN